MARYYTTDELVRELRERESSLRGITGLMRRCDKYVKNARRSGTSESVIETAMATYFEEIKDLLTDLGTDIDTTIANLWDEPDAKYAISVEVGRPAIFNYARTLGYASHTTNKYSIVSATGIGAFSVFDTDDIVEMSGVATSISTKVLAAQSIVLNGAFTADADWDKGGTGWAIAAGVATGTTANGTLNQRAVEENKILQLCQYGNRFTLEYTVSGYSAGSVIPRLGSNFGTLRNADGTYSETITFTNPGDNSNFGFGAAGFSGNIDNVSLIPQDWLFVQPAFAGEDELDLDNRSLKIVLKER